jgi:hypothetical protein
MGTSWLLRGQNDLTTATRVEGALVKMGMQNIHVVEHDRRLLVTYENLRYRFGPVGMGAVLKAMDTLPVSGVDTVTLLVRYRNLPVLAVHAPRWALHGGFPKVASSAIQADWKVEKWEHLMGKHSIINSSFFRLDIPIGPGLRYQLGNFDHPVRAAVDVQIGLDMTLGPGLSVQGLVAVPVYNNLDDKKNIHLERFSVVYDRFFQDQSSISLSGGFFTLNRVGVHAAGRKWFVDERFSLRFDAGITGFSNIGGPVRFKEQERGWFPVYLLGAEYWWPRYSMCVRLTGGRFLYQDEGVTLDVFRQMREFRMGFFVTRTTIESNMGFNLSVPLLPRCYGKQYRVRIRTADQFPFVYRFRGNGRDARRYGVGTNLVDQVYGFYPNYSVQEMWDALDY